jgi:Sec-independent protein secretion pathway component TatC
MKICFMGALAISIPVLVYNLIMFARPAYEAALPKRRIYLMTLASSLLALSGAAFAFFFIVPGSLNFFEGFQVSGLSALISADSYLNFVTNVIITFIIVFQLPLLISFIDKVKPLKPKNLLKMEKWVILGSLVISLIVPFAFDLTTSLFIAAPIVVLYNISILVVLAQQAHRRRIDMKLKRKRNFIKAIPTSGLTLESIPYDDIIDEVPVATPAPRTFSYGMGAYTKTPAAPVLARETTPVVRVSAQNTYMDFRARPTQGRPQPVVSVPLATRVAVPAPAKRPQRPGLISDFGPIKRQPIS